jgi:hypothetical protein
MLDGINPDGLETVIRDQSLDPRVEHGNHIGILRVEILQSHIGVSKGTLFDVGLVVVIYFGERHDVKSAVQASASHSKLTIDPTERMVRSSRVERSIRLVRNEITRTGRRDVVDDLFGTT